MKAGAGGLVAGVLAASIACGKKGPPLPPLVRLPVAPVELSATRRGAAVSVQFTVPRANTDGSTPADLTRVDLFALDGSAPLTPAEILKRGVRIGSVKVNPPRDPDEPDVPAQPKPGEKTAETGKGEKPADGIDQGAVARLSEVLSGSSAADPAVVRSYAVVGINERGRRGTAAQTKVSLVPPPPAPAEPTIDYDEKRIAVTWEALTTGEGKPLAFRVYEPGEQEQMLTKTPLDRTRFDDTRVEWGKERCYVVRTVETTNDLAVESEPSPPTCVTPKDTFAPAAPVGLQAVSVDGFVDLFWESNAERDVAGYHVLRAVAPETQLSRVTSELLATPGFRDAVPKDARVSYAVQAIDTVGNASPVSAIVEETAR